MCLYCLIIFFLFFLGISPEELFFAFRTQYSSLMTKINWGLEFDDNIKFESKKCINGKYFFKMFNLCLSHIFEFVLGIVISISKY